MDTLQQPIAATATAYETSKDEKTGHLVYKGLFTFHNMAAEPTFAWLDSGINAYKPDPLTLPYLRSTIRNYNILLFIGTWCEDSQNLLPKFYKLLSSLDIHYENVVLIGMDRAKTTTTTAGTELVNKYKVSLLPTILFTDSNGQEVGRIIETVSKSIEWDMVEIFSR
jgi:thiol-disulfide isomerase/thioredoxin